MKSLKKQRGFIYLTTGANGAGKTLFTLKEVRERQLAENRPVFHNGRFRLTADFGWKQIDFKDWQKCPDGSIILVDECHNDLPVRRAGSEVPEHIKMLAEHRVRGFDFYLITQHPSNIDVFVRRIIGPPGRHTHLKNAWGSPLVSKITWTAVKTDCEKPGAGEDGTVEMVARPKEVFKWYESATLHTAKPKLPKQFFLAIGAIPAVLVMAYFAYSTFMSSSFMQAATANASIVPDQPLQLSTSVPGQARNTTTNTTNQPATVSEWLGQYRPRIPDFPHTAPAYDELTRPVVAPFPAACIASETRCQCYTQQATQLTVSDATCRDIVQRGFFMAWQMPNGQQAISSPTGSPEIQPGTLNLKF